MEKKSKSRKSINTLPKYKNRVPSQYERLPDANKYKSRLELYCAWKLTEAGIAFAYEPASFVVFEGCTIPFESWEKIGKKFKKTSNKVRRISYKPDFVGNNWIIETKGMRTEDFNLRWKLFKKYLVDNELNYRLYVPSNMKEVDIVIEDISENISYGTYY